jgi:hypothetical protein
MTAPELKPCPFCGGEAQSDGENSTYGRSWWTVWCNACEVELRDREVWDKARPGMLDPAYPAGECLDRWNTRAALPAADPLADPRVRALVEAVGHLLVNYLQDEFNEPDLCVDEAHWSAIHDTRAALSPFQEAKP